MGGAPVINYAVPITEKPEGQSAIYRSPYFKEKLIDRPAPNLGTMKDIFINSSKKYADLPALGRIVKDQNTSTIKYLTYKQSFNKARQIGSGIVHEKLYNVPQGEKMKMFGIFSKNRVQWTVVDIASAIFGLTIIPIYDTLGDQNITYVFNHTQLTTCFVNEGAIKSLIKCKDLVNIKTLICFDKFTEDQVNHFKQRGVKLVPYDSLVDIGKANLKDYNSQEYKVVPDDCLTFSYTSGTTGPPKGAMISHKNFTSFMAAQATNKDTHFNSQDVALSYLPLPHILERQFVFSLLTSGASIVFFSGDVQKLKDDLAIVKPTIFLSVPRLYSRFYDVMKAKFNEQQGMTKKALDYALKTKLQNLRSNGVCTHSIYDRVFFSKTRQALGGRVRIMVSGSAPLLPEVQDFLKVCICAPLVQGYGQTESTGAMTITDGFDPEAKHVGGPVCSCEFKLVDIPEMNYLSTDKDAQGNPTPRGELWSRGPAVFLGYYHDEAKTKETITEDGWLKTGDVAALSAKTRAISLVDRKKNIFKLQQGEYVAAEKVENTYLKGQKLAQIFIHGQSTESFVIAIAVPHKKYVHQFAEKNKIQGTYEQLCQNNAIRAEFVVYLNAIGKSGGLQGFEQVKNIYLETQPFLNKGILTNTMKIQRHEAKKFYRPQIDKLYKQGMLKTN